MSNNKILGVSKDNKYLFTNKGFFVCESEGYYIPYNEGMIPFLVQIFKDNSDFELNNNVITLKEYISRPRKLLYQLSELFQPNQQFRLIKEWEENFGKKTLLNESFNPTQIRKSISESFEGLRTLISEQNNASLASEISSKLIDALSKTFNDDEKEALNQIKRINSKELLDLVSNNIRIRKKMDLKSYINSEMSDVDFEYKSIYNHLKNLDATMASGYKENKFLQGTGKIIDTGAKVGGAILKGLSDVAKKIILPIIKKGVIPLLRWIRRSLNTYLGIIVDVVLSVLPTVAVMKVIWGLIVLLDIYEIATGDFDPDDPERASNPFFPFLMDVVALVSTVGVSKILGLSVKTAQKTGAKVTGKSAGLLRGILNKLPMLKSFFKSCQDFLIKIFGKNVGGFLGKIFGYIDNVVTKLANWLKSMLGETAAELSTKKGLTKVGVSAAIGVGLAELMSEKSFGEGKSGIYGKGDEVKFLQEALLGMAKRKPEMDTGYKGPPTGIYDKETGDAIYNLYKKLGMTPKREATPYIMFFMGIQLEPSGLFKYIPQDWSKNIADVVGSVEENMRKLVDKLKKTENK